MQKSSKDIVAGGVPHIRIPAPAPVPKPHATRGLGTAAEIPRFGGTT